MASGAGMTDAALSPGKRGRSGASTEVIGAPKRGSNSEHVVARFHSSGRRLILPAIATVAACAGTGYLAGRMPESWGAAVLVAGALLVFGLGIVPFVLWSSRVYTVTTRRIVVRSGFLVRSRQEVLLTRGFDITLRRGPLQLLAGSGDIVLETGGDPLVLRDAPSAKLVQAALADLVEYSTTATGTGRQQRINATRRPFDP
jgi:membrane protein YdbS with pleckstrin-like domain